MEKKDEVDNKAIGQRIRQEREKLLLSRGEFAGIIGLSEYYIGQLERGERQMSLSVLVKIANCLHVSLDYLIYGEIAHDACYVHDACNTYKGSDSNKETEITVLLKKCSPKELDLIRKLIKTILPYINISQG
ncbi:MAG: helix-turn-helix transcriptional regulator [Syntrophomonadaceae bacterium]|nr:helix-turn-helix transcriptional regulator [Syntrophomonadaceae bacterium]